MVQVGLGLRSLSVVLFEPCTDFLKMQTVVAAYGCCSIMPQVRWFKTTDISSLTFLETRSRRSRCSLAMLSLKALEKGLSSSCLFLFPDSPWCSNLCLHLQVSFSLFLCLCFSFFSSVQFSRSVMFDSLWPSGLQHARLSCLLLFPRVCSNSCPLSWWWTWVWVNSRSWWWTGRPGMLWFTGSQRVGHDWATDLI